MGELLLGADAGTTALKVCVYEPSGRKLAQASVEYELSHPHPDWAEADAKGYWEAFCRATREALSRAGARGEDVKALAISSQGETLIAVDKNVNPLRPAIVWLDARAKEETEEARREIPLDEVYRKFGMPELFVCSWPPFLRWLRRHEPEVFAKAHKFLLVGEFLVAKLTGEFVGDVSTRASTCVYDQFRMRWDEKALEVAGVDETKLPEIREPGEAVGRLTKRAAKESGLSTETLVVLGALDQHCAAVGAGNVREGVVSESTGAALALVATTGRPVFDPRRVIPVWHHALPRTYSLLPWGSTGGMSLKWFRDAFLPSESYGALDEMASRIPPGSEGLLFLPHLAGAACPEGDENASGVFFGMRLGHSTAHFVRAILEGVAFLLRANLEAMAELGVKASEIRSLGGGSKSDLWCQIKADVAGLPLKAMEETESACAGAAILAGVAAGLLPSVDEAVSRFARVRRSFEPQAEAAEVYDQTFRLYRRLYEALKPVFAEHASMAGRGST